MRKNKNKTIKYVTRKLNGWLRMFVVIIVIAAMAVPVISYAEDSGSAQTIQTEETFETTAETFETTEAIVENRETEETAESTEMEKSSEAEETAETADVISEDSVVLIFENEEETVYQVASASELAGALAECTDSSINYVIEITKNISVGTGNMTLGEVNIPKGINITLTSAIGSVHSITETSRFSGSPKDQTPRGLIHVYGSLTLENITIDANQMGRGIVVDKGASLVLNNGTAVINGVETGTYPFCNSGLGVFLVNGKMSSYATLTINDGAEIRDNFVSGNGGTSESGIGVFAGDYSRVYMNGGKITENHDYSAKSTSMAYGGGLYVGSHVTAVLSGGEISSNNALNGGGGIYIVGSNRSSEVTLCGDFQLINNNANSSEEFEGGTPCGGGIFVTSGILNIEDNAVISGNEAKTNYSAAWGGCGGGIYVSGNTSSSSDMAGPVIYMTGGSITDNTASFDGKALTSDDEDTVRCYDNYIQGCGGGVMLRTGTFEITGGIISGNKAESNRENSFMQGNGGGVFVGVYSENNSTPVTNGQNEGYFNFYGGTITGNSASGKGAGVYLENKMFSVSNNRFNGEDTTVYAMNALTPSIAIKDSPETDDMYLTAPFDGDNGETGVSRLTFMGDLTGTGHIGLNLEEPEKDRIVGIPSSGYSITYGDLEAFEFESDTYELSINNDGNVILKNIKETVTLTDENTEIEVGQAVYCGTAVKPDIKVICNEDVLVEGEDYAVSMVDNTDVGTATLTISGIGNYKGSLKETFKIEPLDIASEDVAIADLPTFGYIGSALTPDVIIKYNGQILEKDTEYTLKYSDNVNVGLALVTVTGIGNFTGSRKVNFEILSTEGSDIITNEDELRAALSKAQGTADAPQKLNIGKSFSIESPVVTSDAIYAVINGNGFTITMANECRADSEDSKKAMIEIMGSSEIGISNLTLDGAMNSRILYVDEGASLSVDSSSKLTRGFSSSDQGDELGGQAIYNAGSVYFDGTISNSRNEKMYSGVVYNSGTFTLGEFGLIENVKTSLGGAVKNAGRFILDGGTISKADSGSSVISSGGGITNEPEGTVIMNSGTITGSNGEGPAVYNAGKFQMNGGAITGNVNTCGGNSLNRTHGVNGGGVLNTLDGNFIMTGGEISNNQSIEGAGVMVKSGSFIMTEGENGSVPEIKNNAAIDTVTGDTSDFNYGNGGGVFVNGGTFTMLAGKITDNVCGSLATSSRASGANVGYGAGIFINGGSVSISGGVISGNEGSENGSNSNGIYFGNSFVSTVNVSSSLAISGSPEIDGCIQIEKDRVIDIPAALGDITINVSQDYSDYGVAVAKYTDCGTDEDGEGAADHMNADDAAKFVPVGEYSFVLNENTRSIVRDLLDLSTCTVKVDPEEYVYSGDAILPTVVVATPGGSVVSGYAITSENNINVGEKTAFIKGDDITAYGELSCGYSITAKELTTAMISLEYSKTAYTGKAITPDVTVRDGRYTLVQGEDYTVDFSDNVEPGTATVTVTMSESGNYIGTMSRTFVIEKKEEDPEDETGSDDKDGKDKEDSQDISDDTENQKSADDSNKKEKTENTDSNADDKQADTDNKSGNSNTSGNNQSSTQSGSSGSTSSGTSGSNPVISSGSSVSSGITTSSGTVSAGLTSSVDKSRQAQSITSQTSEGTVTKYYGDSQFSLGMKSSGTGRLTYSSSDENVCTVSSTGKVTITGCGTAKVTVTAAQSARYSTSSQEITVNVKPEDLTVRLIGATASGNIKVMWMQDEHVSGYQVRYASDESMSDAQTKTVSEWKKMSKVLDELEAGKTYYVQVRSYRLVGEKTIIAGEWSKAKKVTIAKN